MPSTVDHHDTQGLSDDERYRWWFERRWGDGPLLCWVGLNPRSVDKDGGNRRPTLRKVEHWARTWGYDGVLIVNLFAYRATDPKELRTATIDIVGTQNDETLRWATERSGVTLAAWGAGGRLHGRGREVSPILIDPICVGYTKHGEPRHPLYVRTDVERTRYAHPRATPSA